MLYVEVSHELLLAQVQLEADVANASKRENIVLKFLLHVPGLTIFIHFSSLASNWVQKAYY
jgi:hypothetical protein